MKSKVMAYLAAGLTLSAFTWISPAPAEAQVCNSNFQQHRNVFRKKKRAYRKHLRRAYRNNALPVNVNPYIAPVNRNLYGNLVNPYYSNNNGLVRNILNWF